MKNNGFNELPYTISEVDESVYDHIHAYTEILDGVARLTHQSISMVDLFKHEILYITDNPLFTTGLSCEEVKKMKGDFNRKHIPENDFKMIINIFSVWLEFLMQKDADERCLYSLKYDYYLDDKILSTTMMPAFLCNEGKPWIIIFDTRLSTRSESGNAVILKTDTLQKWYYSFPLKKWIESKQYILTDIEQQIIRLSQQGFTENEICKQIYRSKDGLKTIKRKMFLKLSVNNITEAVSLAASQGLI